MCEWLFSSEAIYVLHLTSSGIAMEFEFGQYMIETMATVVNVLSVAIK